jgi:hypothetical protein
LFLLNSRKRGSLPNIVYYYDFFGYRIDHHFESPPLQTVDASTLIYCQRSRAGRVSMNKSLEAGTYICRKPRFLLSNHMSQMERPKFFERIVKILLRAHLDWPRTPGPAILSVCIA